VRIRVGGRIHECRAVEVADLEEKRAFLTALESKYGDSVWFNRDSHQRAWETGDMLVLRIEPR
jgi:hypothetical protein